MPGEDGDELSYVLQRVNSNVFKDPAGVMENIFGVTEYLRNVIRSEGGDPDRETLAYIKTKSGANYLRTARESRGDAIILFQIPSAISLWRSRNSFTSPEAVSVIF